MFGHSGPHFDNHLATSSLLPAFVSIVDAGTSRQLSHFTFYSYRTVNAGTKGEREAEGDVASSLSLPPHPESLVVTSVAPDCLDMPPRSTSGTGSVAVTISLRDLTADEEGRRHRLWSA